MKGPIVKSILGGAVVASLAAVAAKRFVDFRTLKKEVETIPYELEQPFSWKEYFNMRIK